MNQNKLNILTAGVLIISAAILKVTTFPHSVNPIIAISLFSGAVIKDRKFAFAMPLIAMFISDVMLEAFNIAPGFYGMGQIGNYASLLFITLFGFTMKKTNLISVAGYSVLSSLLFFVLSNTNCFFFDFDYTYGYGFSGWANCVAAGIPFVKNSIITDLCFNVVIFSGYVFALKYANKKAIA